MNLIEIPIGDIVPSKTNPRTDFPADYISELAASIRQRGIFNPLLVRGRPLIADGEPPYELIAGECRLRAAMQAGLALVPAIVRADLSNEDVLELQLMENLQRKDLSVLEEADGFAALLDMRGADGAAPRWTIESLSEKLGKTVNYLRQRILLRRLTKEGRKAMVEGSLSFSVARLVCRIPSEQLRARALTDVLKPKFEDEPLSARKAESWIRDNYMTDLKGCPWKLADAELVSVVLDAAGVRCLGGACQDCPFLSGNNPEEFSDVVDGGRMSSVCTHPECYSAKMDASWESERMLALKAGKRVLTSAEAEKILNSHSSGLKYDSPYVPLNEQVPSHELRGDFKKAPTWKKLIADSPAAPEIVVVRDQRGRALEIVDRRQAVAAVKLAAKSRGEEPVIKTGRGSDLDDDAAKAEKVRHRNRQKICRETAFGAMDALRDAIQEKGVIDGFWDQMLDLGFSFAGPDGGWLICKWLALEPEKEKGYGGRDYESALRKGFKNAHGKELLSMVVLLMLSREMKWCASPNEYSPATKHDGVSEKFRAFAQIYGVDIDAIRARVKTEAAEKGKKPKLTEEEAAAEFKKQADAGVKAERKKRSEKLDPGNVKAPVDFVNDGALKPLAAGQALSGMSGDIVRALIAAGPEGMTVPALAKALKSTGGTVSVWFSTTGKKLARKMEPGRYSAFPEIKEEKPEADLPDNPNLAAALALYKSDGSKFSVPLVQRHFKLGYNAACDLHDAVVEASSDESTAKVAAKGKGRSK